MEYKGYIARVEYDDSIELLHGSVVNGGPYSIATCEAADVQTLKDEFRISVDEYLASCEEDGVEPRKPLSGKAQSAPGTQPSSPRGRFGEQERHEYQRLDKASSRGERRLTTTLRTRPSWGALSLSIA